MRFTHSSRGAALLTAGFIAAAALACPAAQAEGGGVPGEPGEPYPAPTPGMVNEGAGNGCQGGEIRVDGNCIPGATGGGQESRTTESFVNPVENMPNINGDPCAGAWVSAVCYAEGGGAPVQPHSELSVSP